MKKNFIIFQLYSCIALLQGCAAAPIVAHAGHAAVGLMHPIVRILAVKKPTPGIVIKP